MIIVKNPGKASRGAFICLEGIDGCGTTTHASIMQNRLDMLNCRVRVVRHPTQGDIGQLIRQILVSPSKKLTHDGDIMARLFTADLLYSYRTNIKPALEDGCVVIADRFFLSTVCYQSAEAGEPLDVGGGKLHEGNLNMGDLLLALTWDIPWPDLTLVIDVPSDICMERVRARGKPLDAYENLEFQTRVRGNYMTAVRSLPRPSGKKMVLIDGHADVAVVSERVYRACGEFLQGREEQ